MTKYFGLRSFSTLYGWTWTAYAIAGAIGPIIMGRAFDATGSYQALLGVLAFVTLIAASLMLSLPGYAPAPAAEVEHEFGSTQSLEAAPNVRT